MNLFSKHGFEVEHTPGIARSLIRIEGDGDQIIVTDEEGYDLPSSQGPFKVMCISRDNDLIAGPEMFESFDGIIEWLASRER